MLAHAGHCTVTISQMQTQKVRQGPSAVGTTSPACPPPELNDDLSARGAPSGPRLNPHGLAPCMAAQLEAGCLGNTACCMTRCCHPDADCALALNSQHG